MLLGRVFVEVEQGGLRIRGVTIVKNLMSGRASRPGSLHELPFSAQDSPPISEKPKERPVLDGGMFTCLRSLKEALSIQLRRPPDGNTGRLQTGRQHVRRRD